MKIEIWNLKFKFKTEIWNWNWKLKLKIIIWNWKLKLKWNWKLTLKIDIKNWNCSHGLKDFFYSCLYLNFLYRSKGIDKCIQSQNQSRGLKERDSKESPLKIYVSWSASAILRISFPQSLFEIGCGIARMLGYSFGLSYVNNVICCRIIGSRPVGLYKLTSRPNGPNRLYTPFC